MFPQSRIAASSVHEYNEKPICHINSMPNPMINPMAAGR